MSRGHGKIQRFILEHGPKERLEREIGATVNEFAEGYANGGKVTVSLKVSMRAALRLLADEGLVGRIQSGRDIYWYVKSTRKRKPGPRKPRPETPERIARAQIAKILGTMGSEHEGERLAAIRKAEALRRKLGVTWQDLIKK
jgi:hypothetical protein